MKKTIRIAALLLLILLVLTGCNPVDPPADEEPTSTPIPTPVPTKAEPTLEPTITPRIFTGAIEEPSASATPLLVYPVDLPELKFSYEDVTSQKINASFKIPAGWIDVSVAEDANTVIYMEPSINSVTRIPVQSTILISVFPMQSVQTAKMADDELNRQIDELKKEYPSLRVTGASSSRLMGELGTYVSYWVEHEYGENGKTESMRGRLHVTPVDRKLYIIRTMHPADFNVEYDQIYKDLRASFKEV